MKSSVHAVQCVMRVSCVATRHHHHHHHQPSARASAPSAGCTRVPWLPLSVSVLSQSLSAIPTTAVQCRPGPTMVKAGDTNSGPHLLEELSPSARNLVGVWGRAGGQRWRAGGGRGRRRRGRDRPGRGRGRRHRGGRPVRRAALLGTDGQRREPPVPRRQVGAPMLVASADGVLAG